MNDHIRTNALLESATADLEPPIDRLVAGGVARGRRLQRRRRATHALAAVAVVGVIGTAASVTPLSDTLRGSDSEVAVAPPAPSAPDQAPARRVGIDQTKTAAVLSTLLPDGPVRWREAWYDEGFQAASLLFSGREVTVRIDDPAAGAGEARARCEEQKPALACVEAESGDWIGSRTVEEADGSLETSRVSTTVSRFTRDGFTVMATASNTDGEPGAEPSAPRPPLSIAELTTIVTDPIWISDPQ